MLFYVFLLRRNAWCSQFEQFSCLAFDSFCFCKLQRALAVIQQEVKQRLNDGTKMSDPRLHVDVESSGMLEKWYIQALKIFVTGNLLSLLCNFFVVFGRRGNYDLLHCCSFLAQIKQFYVLFFLCRHHFT